MDELELLSRLREEVPPRPADRIEHAFLTAIRHPDRRLPPLAQAAVRDAPDRQHVKRARGWLLPLAVAASTAVIALGAVVAAHPASHTGTKREPAATAQAPWPKFYMTMAIRTTNGNALQFQVRRTADGAVTASTSISIVNMFPGDSITAAASDRAFYYGLYPCTATAVANPVTTFYRITITGSGRIAGIAAAGHVQGKLNWFAVSPDGSQMAYDALPGGCGTPDPVASAASSTVGILDLPTGTARTWQNTKGLTTRDAALSWAPDGRMLIINSQVLNGAYLTVLGLDTASSGGSLQAHSKTLLQDNNPSCYNLTSTCVDEVFAGPHDSMTAVEPQKAGRQTRTLVVSIPLAAGHPQTVLYSIEQEPAGSYGDLTEDPSCQRLILWTPSQHAAGWLSGGRLHPLPAPAPLVGIAW